MKNYAEQQMGAVLNPSSSSDDIPEDVIAAAMAARDAIDDAESIRDAVFIIADVVFAERNRATRICTDHIKVLRHVFQNDTARAIEQVRAEIRGSEWPPAQSPNKQTRVTSKHKMQSRPRRELTCGSGRT